MCTCAHRLIILHTCIYAYHHLAKTTPLNFSSCPYKKIHFHLLSIFCLVLVQALISHHLTVSIKTQFYANFVINMIMKQRNATSFFLIFNPLVPMSIIFLLIHHNLAIGLWTLGLLITSPLNFPTSLSLTTMKGLKM